MIPGLAAFYLCHIVYRCLLALSDLVLRASGEGIEQACFFFTAPFDTQYVPLASVQTLFGMGHSQGLIINR